MKSWTCHGGRHDQKDQKIRIDLPPPPADDRQRRRGACRLAISHQSAAGAGSHHQDRLSGSADRALRRRSAGSGARRGSRRRRVQRRRRPQRSQGGTAGARRQAQSGRSRDADPGTDRKGKGQLRRRQSLRRRSARGQQRHQGARHHLQFDQPVRHHQRSLRLQQIHLPRGAEPASDRGRGGPLRVPEIRQEGRLPHRGLRLRPRDGSRLPGSRQGVRHRDR